MFSLVYGSQLGGLRALQLLRPAVCAGEGRLPPLWGLQRQQLLPHREDDVLQAHLLRCRFNTRRRAILRCSKLHPNLSLSSFFLFCTEPQGVSYDHLRDGEHDGPSVRAVRRLPLSAGHGLDEQRGWIHAGSVRSVSWSERLPETLEESRSLSVWLRSFLAASCATSTPVTVATSTSWSVTVTEESTSVTVSSALMPRLPRFSPSGGSSTETEGLSSHLHASSSFFLPLLPPSFFILSHNNLLLLLNTAASNQDLGLVFRCFTDVSGSSEKETS